MFTREEIFKKIEQKVELSEKEYKYYLIEIMRLSEIEANTIITIGKNTNPSIRID